MGLGPQETSFALDTMGRFLCNTLDEASASASISIGGSRRDFDVIVIGGGTFGAIMATSLLLDDTTHSRRILVLEAGPFTLPEHVQNLPFQGATPDFRAPWDSHSALGYPGLMFTIGGRSLAWGGWSPQLLEEELVSWPQSVRDELLGKYFRDASEQLGVAETNDFIYGRLHVALRKQLFEGIGGVPLAFPVPALPDHPVYMYAAERLATTSAAAAVAGAAAGGAPGATAAIAPRTPPIEQLREWLGLPATDPSTYDDLRNMLKLEAPLAVQATTEPGLFPFNKFSAVPNLVRVARIASAEAGGIEALADARKRLMIVPKCRVLDIITVTQLDGWVRVTGVRVKDAAGAEKAIWVALPRSGGRQGTVVIALGTIESTRLALNTFKESLNGRAAQRMGTNLMAHLRSNLHIRIPVSSLKFLPPSDRKSLQASALFIKGRKKIGNKDRYFHLQITASGLNRLADDSEAELFKKIPDLDHIEAMLRADDTHVVITIRAIGEMTPKNPDSSIRLSPTKTEDGRPVAEVSLADVRDGTSATPESDIDKQTWAAMDNLSDEVALIFANKQPFEILFTNQGRNVSLSASATVADLQIAHPHKDRHDKLGTTHHDAGTMWMGLDRATSVTNEYGRIHDTTNCYVASPAIFPTVGSPNPMLTGTALARRTASMLTDNVLPRPVLRAPDAGFRVLFNGTSETFKRWKLASRKDSQQGFAHIDGHLVSYGSADFAILYYAPEGFHDFHLRLQFKIFDVSNHNSGVFIRFREPLSRMPDEIRRRARAEGAPIAENPAYTAVFSGFEVQVDDNARGDSGKDFYGRRPEPDGLWKNRTGAIYKIPAGDFIYHLGRPDERLQQYVPGPALMPNVWFQYDIVVIGNHYEVTLTNTESGALQKTTVFDNTDGERGLAKVDGRPAGYIGIQSYPNSQVAYRDIWIK